MPTKYCAHGLCDSDSRKHPNINFAKFIPPSVNRLRSERWVHLMGRKNFTVDNVKAWTYICEKHFAEGANLKYYEVCIKAFKNLHNHVHTTTRIQISLTLPPIILCWSKLFGSDQNLNNIY